MLKVSLSFDDSLVDQFKWARTMALLNLKGVFYVSPGRLNRPPNFKRCEWFLTEEHVERMAKWGHTIGNHTWDHEAPGMVGVADTVASIEKAAEWLAERSYASKLLALPFGSRGGKWPQGLLSDLITEGYILRDVRFENDAPDLKLPCSAALESTVFPDLDFSGIDYRYFHGNHATSDDDLADFLYGLNELRSAGRLSVVLPTEGD